MAGSIELFSIYRKYCHVFGLYPPQSNENGPSINWRNWIFIISFVLWALSSAAFLIFEAKSMIEYGLSFFAVSGAVFLMGVYLVVLWQMKNTLTFVENCERFIGKREESIITYQELIEKIERLCELVFIALSMTVLFLTLPFLIHSIVHYYILDLGKESFVLLFPVKWPFDWKTPLGYFVAWLVEFAGATMSGIVTAIFVNLILGSCWLFMFMAEDITKNLAVFNNIGKTNENRVEWRKRFCNIVQLYSDTKLRVNEFNAIVKYLLFIIIFFLMLCESSTLLTLRFQFLDENAKLLETFMMLILAFWTFGVLFAICELGERMTLHFEMFREELERCDWHTLPIELQRIYLIFLSDTQQPKNIACYGNILCIRDTFKEITNTGFSYFMALSRFET